MNKDEFYNKKEEEEYLYVSDDEDEFTEQQDNNLLFKHLLDLNEIAGFLLLEGNARFVLFWLLLVFGGFLAVFERPIRGNRTN